LQGIFFQVGVEGVSNWEAAYIGKDEKGLLSVYLANGTFSIEHNSCRLAFLSSRPDKYLLAEGWRIVVVLKNVINY